jgi:hypothetical protein
LEESTPTTAAVVRECRSAQRILPLAQPFPVEQALISLLWINVFRYAPLVCWSRGQVSEQVALSTRSLIVYGDLAAGLLALLAGVLLQAKVRRAAAAVWLFVIVGVADSFIGLVVASPARVYLHPLGTSWFVVAFYVPVTMAFEVPHRISSGRQTKAVAADGNAQRVAGVVPGADQRFPRAHRASAVSR